VSNALDDAIWTAKVVAGLDPTRAYPPAEWIDHLEPRWARQFWASQVDRVVEEALGAPRHNHFTRMVMAPGKCPRCDELSGHTQREAHSAAVAEWVAVMPDVTAADTNEPHSTPGD
jgi:hypothetical protein